MLNPKLIKPLKGLFLILLLLIGLGAVGQNQAFEKGLSYYHDRDYDKAFKYFDMSYFKYGNAEAAYYIGEIKRKKYDYEGALRWHKKAIHQNAQHSFWGYCITLIQQGRVHESRRYAKQKLLLNPNDKDLPKIIQACDQVLAGKFGTDSLKFLSTKDIECLTPEQDYGYHTENDIIKGQEVSYILSSIYPEGMDTTRIIRQNRKVMNRRTKDLMLYSVNHKEDHLGYATLVDGKEVSYAILPDFFLEHLHDVHYDGAENFYATIVDGKATELEESEIFRTNRNIKYPAISPTGKVMIFASNQLRDSYGGYDLYKVVYRFPNWTNPQNLGPEINTEGDEIYPFISLSNRLYFSSDGLGAYGDQDIYSIDLDRVGHAKPRHLSPPINSVFDDFGYVINEKSGLGLFMTNRNKGQNMDRIFFQKILDNCNAKEVLRRNTPTTECNDSLYCVDLKLGGPDSLGIPIEYEWYMGDGSQVMGNNRKYCYEKGGLYKAKVLMKVQSRTGKIMERSFDVDFDLRIRDVLNIHQYKYSMSVLLSAENTICNGCHDIRYYWKVGDLYRCGETVEIFEHAPGTPYEVLMTYNKSGKQYTKSCSGVVIE